MLFLGIEHQREGPALELDDVDIGERGRTWRIAHNIDQSIDCVHAAEQIVVFAIGARQECRKMRKPYTLETLNTCKALERACVLRADAINPNVVELAGFARVRHRKREHIPERKAEMIDEDFAAR